MFEYCCPLKEAKFQFKFLIYFTWVTLFNTFQRIKLLLSHYVSERRKLGNRLHCIAAHFRIFLRFCKFWYILIFFMVFFYIRHSLDKGNGYLKVFPTFLLINLHVISIFGTMKQTSLNGFSMTPSVLFSLMAKIVWTQCLTFSPLTPNNLQNSFIALYKNASPLSFNYWARLASNDHKMDRYQIYSILKIGDR